MVGVLGKELKRMLSGNPKTLSRDVTVCASFSFNENYIVTGDDQNNVLVFVCLYSLFSSYLILCRYIYIIIYLLHFD